MLFSIIFVNNTKKHIKKTFFLPKLTKKLNFKTCRTQQCLFLGSSLQQPWQQQSTRGPGRALVYADPHQGSVLPRTLAVTYYNLPTFSAHGLAAILNTSGQRAGIFPFKYMVYHVQTLPFMFYHFHLFLDYSSHFLILKWLAVGLCLWSCVLARMLPLGANSLLQPHSAQAPNLKLHPSMDKIWPRNDLLRLSGPACICYKDGLVLVLV